VSGACVRGSARERAAAGAGAAPEAPRPSGSTPASGVREGAGSSGGWPGLRASPLTSA